MEEENQTTSKVVPIEVTEISEDPQVSEYSSPKAVRARNASANEVRTTP